MQECPNASRLQEKSSLRTRVYLTDNVLYVKLVYEDLVCCLGFFLPLPNFGSGISSVLVKKEEFTLQRMRLVLWISRQTIDERKIHPAAER